MCYTETYSKEPIIQKIHLEKWNDYYSKYALLYDLLVKKISFWNCWIRQVIPHISGPKVLEVSCGTGYLLSLISEKYATFGMDFNENMLGLARKKLKKKGISSNLLLGDVENIPFKEKTFDTVISTLAFNRYPNGGKSLAEIYRVLKPQGRLLLVEVNYPNNRNFIGGMITKYWQYIIGDIIRDIPLLLNKHQFEFQDREIGGFGSVHLYLANKKE